jgi:hypothetical protein
MGPRSAIPMATRQHPWKGRVAKVDAQCIRLALVGFQGRGCADGVQRNFCPPFLLEGFFFNGLEKALHFSDNIVASDPEIQ